MTQPYFASSDPEDLPAVCWREAEQNRIAVIRYLSRGIDPANVPDYEGAVHDIALRLGLSKREAQRHLDAMLCLDELPQFDRLREKLGCITLAHLIAISRALWAAPHHPDVFTLADELLVNRFTPRMPGQPLPSAWGTRRWLLGNLERLLDHLVFPAAKKAEDERVCSEAHYSFSPEGFIGLTTAPATAIVMDQIITQSAVTFGLEPAEALVKLITDKVDVRVTINTVGLPADPTEPMDLYLQGAGQLRNHEERWLAPMVTKLRNITGAGESLSGVHDPSPSLRHFVLARDGHCRYPDCQRETKLQIHHVIAHERGGPTTATNLASLCQHHHNKISGGLLRMYMTESGVCHWYSPHGHFGTTLPEGPLADPKRFRFHTTREEHIARQREYWTNRRVAEQERPARPHVEPIFPPEPEEWAA